MKIRGDPLLYIVIMVIMLVIIVASLMMEYFESKFLPLMLSGVVFVLAGAGLLKEILAGYEPAVTVAKGETGRRKEAGVGWHGLLLNGAWVVVLCLGIYLLGFMITIPLFVLSYTKWLGTRWRTAVIFAVLTPAIIYGIFQLALGVKLYPGLLFHWLGY